MLLETVKYALLLEYDGSHYFGWQIQRGVATVQAELERALSRFAHHPITTITAGRTDSGVHALNQVVHFTSSAKRELHGWIRGVNALLPSSIRVKAIQPVAADFDARFSALSRTYHYYVLLQAQPSALWHAHLGYYYKPLDVANMQQAASLLLGRHDFSAFRAAACQAATPVREMLAAQVEQRGKILRVSLTANAFLHHMVRNVVGALLYVGNGRISLEQFKAIFVAASRMQAPPTFMPNGLYLIKVAYPQLLFPAASADNWLFNL